MDRSELERSRKFTKVIALWIPGQFITSAGVDVACFISDVNEKVRRRGFILWDGQILKTPISDSLERGIIKPKSQPVTISDGQDSLLKPILSTVSTRVGERTELHYPEVMPEFSEEAREFMFEVPPRRDWRDVHKAFFRLDSPYQMAEEGTEYTQWHITTRISAPYIESEERIAAILHGERDGYYFYCTCHQAEVVYTTRHRLVCMGCGAMHMVLRRPLPLHSKRLLTQEEWIEFFDDDGAHRDEEIELSVVDFQDVERAETIWVTDQWDEAARKFVFFARSSPEEIAEATRGTESDPSVFLEAGWTLADTAPPPAHQLADDSIDVDLIENAAHSIRDGVASFLRARQDSGRLVSAIPELFRAVELLLKARLQELDANGLDDRPNSPTVLKRLKVKGVLLTQGEIDNVSLLRRIRNDLQHGGAKLNYRAGLAVSRKALIFLNRFAHDELGLWLGDLWVAELKPSEDWHQLLAITDIAITADRIVKDRLDRIRQHPEATISLCERCGREAVVRCDENTGALCVFCGYIPRTSTGG